jgi:hypothetical protein
MIEAMSGFPEYVVAMEAVGEVDADDYKNVLIPAVEEKLRSYDKIRFLYVLGDRFTGYRGSAMWEDTKLGLEHFNKWERCAVVSDHDWIRHGIKALGWLIPGQVRVYPLAERDDAEAWIRS